MSRTAQPAASLVDTMNALADEHGFHAVSVSFNRQCSVDWRWSANVHWCGFSRDGITCASGHGLTPLDALNNAVLDAAKDREPYPNDEKQVVIARLREQLEALEADQ